MDVNPLLSNKQVVRLKLNGRWREDAVLLGLQYPTDADPAKPGTGDGYSKPARDGLKKLIDGKPAGR
jgi:hypothetical protein